MAAVAVTLALAGNALAIQREGRAPKRDRAETGIVKVIKKMVRALGDGLIIPIP